MKTAKKYEKQHVNSGKEKLQELFSKLNDDQYNKKHCQYLNEADFLAFKFDDGSVLEFTDSEVTSYANEKEFMKWVEYVNKPEYLKR